MVEKNDRPIFSLTDNELWTSITFTEVDTLVKDDRDAVTAKLVSTVELFLDGASIKSKRDKDNNLILVQSQADLEGSRYEKALFVVTHFGRSEVEQGRIVSRFVAVETYAVYPTRAEKIVTYYPAFHGAARKTGVPEGKTENLSVQALAELLVKLKDTRELDADEQ